ncbi:auxin-responsive protein SAUR71-like [Ananas comosus]|uniref:Auxin-responsive protein SAUR71-like n=1 Tax=Ananas comosus TaxID=4615 RepID=A0A6P5G5F3_ANACO|nr:auxin-responsive protein SAUR71-like [Ananas comosus]
MKRLMRRISRVADSSEHRPLWKGEREEEEERGRDRRRRRRRPGGGRVPEGHVPVCVGEEMERFAVRAELLGRPAFVELLRRSAAEYGYEQRGVLRIPCPVPLFRRLLLLLSLSHDHHHAAADPAVHELFRSLPDD